MGVLPRAVPVLAAVVAAVVGSCASGRQIAYEPADLRAELRHRLGQERAATLVVPFEIGPELKRLAREVTAGATGNPAKLEQLALALGSPAELRLHYDAEVTAAAEETLRRGGGDCLSLTSLFIGMARSIGLPVFFVDARGVQDVTVEGDLVLDRRHVVAGYGPAPGFTVVDFERVSTGPAAYRVLTDIQALARFYNNLGYVALKERRDSEALAHFETALDLDRTYAAAHNNAAIALLRMGRTPKAEEHLILALRHEPNYAAALLNLAGVLERSGRIEQAETARAHAAAVRVRDPLWRMLQGQEALARGDAVTAVREFRVATKLDERLAGAWLGLAEAYAALGDRPRALQASERALRLAPQDVRVRDLRNRLGAS